ncbi:MAG: hypothetical protein M1840_006589 [Geoglossum simile]|nr:MAG: hypothetical protein M1840_006589 [Geoglossum simile]
MNPYVSNPDNIPASNIHVDVPFYGRYFPRSDDFYVDLQHVNSRSADSLPDEGGRDVFALGSIIIKSSHLHKIGDGRHTEIDYSYADANEVQAVAIAKSVLKSVRVPEIYFAGKINDRQVLVQERIPGVGLDVAWPYLSQGQKESFKQQAREILRQLHTIKPTDGRRARCYVVQDPNILTNGRIGPLEGDILFSDTNIDLDMSFTHNDFTLSNCIVDNNKVVGLVDWEMAGFFGWKTVGEIHRRIRTPQREHFVNANLSEEMLQDIMRWNDLYDDSMSVSVVEVQS